MLMDREMLYNNLRDIENEGVESAADLNEESDNDLEELEIALYSQIHFETNDTADTLFQEGLQKNEISDMFVIDVEGNCKSGFHAGLTTADFVIDERIKAEYVTQPVANRSYLTSLNKDDKCVALAEQKSVQETVFFARKDTDAQCYRKKKLKSKIKNNVKENLAEKLILNAGSSSESESTDDKKSDSSHIISDTSHTETDSDDSLVELDVDDREDYTDLFINVNKNQQPLIKTTAVDGWNVDDADMQSNSSKLNRSRYFKDIRCYNCDAVGHLSKNCPKPKKEQTCGFCSESGHHMKICPDSFCYNCEEPGHIAKECQLEKKKWFIRCSRCLMQGHKQSKCPDTWRQYHRTVNGKKLITEMKHRQERNTFCYNCAADDHLGHECEEDRMDSYSQASYPFICKYTPKEFGNYLQAERKDAHMKEIEIHVIPGEKKKNSQAEREDFCMKEIEIHVIPGEKRKVSHAFVNKERLAKFTGRSNLDNLQFANNKHTVNKANFKLGPKHSKKNAKKTEIKRIEPDILYHAKKRKTEIGADKMLKKHKVFENSERTKDCKSFKKSKKKDSKRRRLDSETSFKKQRTKETVDDHQVFHNQWWFKKGGKKRSKRNENW